MRGDIDVETRAAARAGTGTPSMVDACRVLDTVFGFEAFRPGQEAVIEALLGGRDVLTVMPTGSGKSLCFQVPALVMDGLTVVVSPLVALMQDQVAALKLAGVAADGIHSGNAREDNAAAWRRAAAGGTRLLYMAPERLMTERVLTARRGRLPLRLFAIDEAALLAALKALRLELARERGVPAYIVFPDRTLSDMARRRPRSEAEFAEVNGVGAVKLEQFAQPFLAAIDAVLSKGDAGGAPQADGS